ncbi:proline--tRNA ligase [Fodinisporobacter ferrooxydans]|uniref:Proline--tRNA ligase n=1 Tax=Fodinisporobacter ferrooxydans TaxID=2901836 RepID=A0ABY4CMY0_9BACL|nr:proline--tRNA ligase [Alicyclobacillaceae bacterium MYW30-H2]
MLQSKLLLPTLREAPAEAEIISHKLLIRAGLIRQLASGVYTYLPLGYRTLRKVEAIVREEMDKSGAQELNMSVLQPIELWRESGRDSAYGPELVRLKDRHEREFVLGPTNEEVITTVVKNEIKSYRKLPINLYQIQTKFRDERRPRFGLMRGREFLMKDAYSFDLDWNGLDVTYRGMYDAYTNIFTRCGVRFRAVEADAGAIGGEGGTHEFMVLAEIGEDTIISCNQCSYAANLEKAVSGVGKALQSQQIGIGNQVSPAYESFATPNLKTIEQLAGQLGVDASSFVKTLIYQAGNELIAVVVRGDRDVNEVKVKNYLGLVEDIELASESKVQAVTNAAVGFAGPVELAIPILVDQEVAAMGSVVCGANQTDQHLRHVLPGRDFPLDRIGDFCNVRVGDPCPNCDGTLEAFKGIEVGHIFKLGTKYSEKLGAAYIDQDGQEKPMIMGCYGIGISRVVQAVVEQNYDDNGIIWPLSIAPYHVHVIPVSMKDETQRSVANELYQTFQDIGADVLLDDRDERPGVKFKDSDLIGIPIRITVGKQAGEGIVEVKLRSEEDKQLMNLEEVVSFVKNQLATIG